MHHASLLRRRRPGSLPAVAASLLVLTATLPVSAQSAAGTASTAAPAKSDKTANEVVLLEAFKVESGFRGSLAAAAAEKQTAPTITEVIAAEDIGKLPDLSIADSLTRLTGLATQRTNGRAQGISIRGLTGDFSTGMLNGREQVSTNLNRAVEFDQYPTELLNGVVVYKTAASNLVAQGLAGTIDLQTVKPLSKGRRTVAGSAYYQWTQFGELTPGAKKDGNRFNFSYIDQLADKKVGVALGVAHTSTPFEGQQFQAWGYPTDSAGNFALGGTKSYVRTSNLDRDGLMGVVEYKPNDRIHSTVDFYTSKFKEKQLLRGLEIPLAFWSSAQLQPGYTVNDGLVTSAVLKNVQPVLRNDTVTRRDNLVAAGWNLRLGERTGWTTVFDAGYSRVKRTDENLETYSGLGFNQTAANPDTMTVKLVPGRTPVFTPTVNYADASLFRLTDPQGWGVGTLPATGMDGYLKYFQSKDELGQLKLLTRHPLPGVFSDVEVGASFTDRYKRDGEKPTGFIYPATGQTTAALPPIIGTTDMTFLGLGRIYAYDPAGAYRAGTYGFLPNPNNDVVANRWTVREKISRAYFQLDLDSKVREVPLTGNVGLQVIHADQSSSGNSAIGSGGTLKSLPVSGGARYTDLAPSLNLNFKPAEGTVLRASAARQIARPRMFDTKAARSFSYSPALANSTDLGSSPWSGGGGNPRLRPWKADSVDLSLEKYFKDNMGYVSLTAFHKKLLSYIYEQKQIADFSGYPTTDGSRPALSQGVMSTPVNGEGGAIKGLEATLSLPSELLGKSIRGFGVVLGGAYTDSSVKPWGPTSGSAPIAGLSRKVANVTLYYERGGFSARVSERYRSDYRAYITTFGPPNFKGDVNPNGGFSTSQPERVVDAQLSYALLAGRLKGLTLYAQAYNLNNEPLVTYQNNDPRRVTNYQKYGASYSTGVSYKF